MEKHESRDVLAFLGALCLFLSVLEYLIPKPPPLIFFRLGLANIPILLAMPALSFGEFLLLLVLKVLGQAIVNGTLASYVFLFSAGGTLASGLVMWILGRGFRGLASPLGLSVAGAMASNLVQVVLGMAFIFGSTAWIIAPLFMSLGLVSGILTGLFTLHFSRTSHWYAAFLSPGAHGGGRLPVHRDNLPVMPEGPVPEIRPRRVRWRAPASWDILAGLPAGVLFWWGLALLPLFLLQPDPVWRGIQVAVLGVLAVLGGKRVRFLHFATIISGIAFFQLMVPRGRVILDLPGLPVTDGALAEGFGRGLGIAGLVLLSLATVRRNLRLPGRFGALLVRMFWCHELLMASRSRMHPGRLVQGLDRILTELGMKLAAQEPGGAGAPPVDALAPAGRWKGVLAVTLASTIFIMPLILPLFWRC